MQQTIQSLSALERRVDLTVPAAAIEQEVKTRLAKLARGMKVPGFRPGKVPMKMVAQTYGAQVQAEVLNDKVGEAFNSAVTAGKLKVAGQPRLEPRTVADGESESAGSNDLTFSATFEINPEISVGDLSGTEVQRATCAIGEDQIDRTLQIMQKQRATFEDVKRAAQDGDDRNVEGCAAVQRGPAGGSAHLAMAVAAVLGKVLAVALPDHPAGGGDRRLDDVLVQRFIKCRSSLHLHPVGITCRRLDHALEALFDASCKTLHVGPLVDAGAN
jgi:hypothetical protein